MRNYAECQAFVEHLRAAHTHIRQAVLEVEKELLAAVKAPRGSRVADTLMRLRAVLSRHFEEEGAGGCLEEAACHCPRLSQAVAGLQQEHPLLLRLLDRLIAQVKQSDAASHVESFRRISKAIHQHETAEDQILEEAFGTGEFE